MVVHDPDEPQKMVERVTSGLLHPSRGGSGKENFRNPPQRPEMLR
jgi:hypothetical protein